MNAIGKKLRKTLATSTAVENQTVRLIHAGTELSLRLANALDMADREIDEVNSTDVDGLEVLLRGMRAEVAQFDHLVGEINDRRADGDGSPAVADAEDESGILRARKLALHEMTTAMTAICKEVLHQVDALDSAEGNATVVVIQALAGRGVEIMSAAMECVTGDEPLDQLREVLDHEWARNV